MNDLYVELRDTTSATSWDIARHLFARQLNGNVAVVADNPVALLSAVKKQWARLERQVQRERASTLDATRIWALCKALSYMQNLYFTVESSENNGRSVVFAGKDYFLKIPPACHTLYVTLQVSKDDQITLTSRMPRYALVVNYIP